MSLKSIERNNAYNIIMMDIIPDLTKMKSKGKNISSDIQKVTKILDERSGEVEYETVDSIDGDPFEGDIQICVHTKKNKAERSLNSFVLLSLRLNLSPLKLELPDSVKSFMEKKKKGKTYQMHTPSEIHEKTIVNEMESLQYGVDDLISNMVAMRRISDDIKEKENEFHQRSEAIIESMRNWPIIHILILIVTGLCQANHMITFFKTHHII